MFENLAHYQHIIVTGPQRSGTRIAAHAIAQDTGKRYVDEQEFGIHDVQRLQELLDAETGLVVQCPAVCHAVVSLAGPDRLIVMMLRPLDDIYASQKRVGWMKGRSEVAKYGRSECRAADIKYAYWLSIQRQQIQHWFELPYEALKDHPLWVGKDKRADFAIDQWQRRERTAQEWIEYCRANISAGYVPDGDKAQVYVMGAKLAEIFHEHLPWQAGDSILDVGSGNGRLAFGLLGSGLIYHGLEIIRPCVEFCHAAFAEYPEFHFYHLDLYNEHYWAVGKTKQDQVTYPIPDASIDYVVAHSLFSHTGTISNARRNLEEMKRVLKPGGLLCSTWFLAPPRQAPDNDEALTVYWRADFEMLVHDFEIVEDFTMPTNKQSAFVLLRKND
jgi:SAM-dependent methyltransferase